VQDCLRGLWELIDKLANEKGIKIDRPPGRPADSRRLQRSRSSTGLLDRQPGHRLQVIVGGVLTGWPIIAKR